MVKDSFDQFCGLFLNQAPQAVTGAKSLQIARTNIKKNCKEMAT